VDAQSVGNVGRSQPIRNEPKSETNVVGGLVLWIVR